MTGVQTCALPIWCYHWPSRKGKHLRAWHPREHKLHCGRRAADDARALVRTKELSEEERKAAQWVCPIAGCAHGIMRAPKQGMTSTQYARKHNRIWFHPTASPSLFKLGRKSTQRAEVARTNARVNRRILLLRGTGHDAIVCRRWSDNLSAGEGKERAWHETTSCA